MAKYCFSYLKTLNSLMVLLSSEMTNKESGERMLSGCWTCDCVTSGLFFWRRSWNAANGKKADDGPSTIEVCNYGRRWRARFYYAPKLADRQFALYSPYSLRSRSALRHEHDRRRTKMQVKRVTYSTTPSVVIMNNTHHHHLAIISFFRWNVHFCYNPLRGHSSRGQVGSSIALGLTRFLCGDILFTNLWAPRLRLFHHGSLSLPTIKKIDQIRLHDDRIRNVIRMDTEGSPWQETKPNAYWQLSNMVGS